MNMHGSRSVRARSTTSASSVVSGLLLAGLVLALAAPAAAFGRGHPGRGGHGGPGGHGPHLGAMIDHHAELLGLDEDTRATIRQIVEDSHAERKELRRETKEARAILHEMLEADVPDRDAVLDQVERVGELKTASKKHRVETLLEIRSLLTPEQRATLKEMRESFRERHLGAIFEACETERAELCPERGPRGLHCLHRQGDALSPACAEALAALPVPRHRGWRHSRGGE